MKLIAAVIAGWFIAAGYLVVKLCRAAATENSPPAEPIRLFPKGTFEGYVWTHHSDPNQIGKPVEP